MNMHNYKVSIIDCELNVSYYEFIIDEKLSLIDKYRKLSALIVEKIPFSFIKSRIIVLYPDYVDENEVNKILMTKYNKMQKKYFKDTTLISDRISIINVFEKLFICIYLIKCYDKIFGFGYNGGGLLTEMIYFDSNDSIDYMINHISEAMLQEAEKFNIKKDIESELYPCKNLIISFDNEYYYTKNINNVENNYIEDILNVGLIKHGEKCFSFPKR